jgi:aryl-alcohol dehydrogenase-like predicted oxidoreductase/predicted kinase
MIGLGCMRLSGVERGRAVATIHAALDAGLTFLDTANVYAPSELEIGHNERLVAEALAGWRGDRSRVRIATKGGLVREGGRWRPDGRARSLAAACEASLRALDVAAVDLYLLHAVDPRVSIETSARALESLRRAGLAREIGLCNVNLAQLDAASRVATISAVQVRAGPKGDEAVRSGIAGACKARGLLWMAHSPFGGERGVAKLSRDDAWNLPEGTPAEIALLVLLLQGAMPLPGATRPETARSCGAALELGAQALAEIDRSKVAWRPGDAVSRRYGNRDVLMILGGPASGKTTLARSFVDQGYIRLNRDERGGRLDALADELDDLLGKGETRVVLDNTYPTRVARSRVIDAAARHAAGVRCIWLDTSLEQAEANACARLVERHGSLPTPAQLAANARKDPAFFGPTALYRARRAFEPPAADELFASIERRAFEPLPASGENAGLILDASVLWRSRSGARLPTDPGDVDVLPNRREVLARGLADGRVLVGTAWLPDRDEDAAFACLAALNERLDVPVAWGVCTHPGGPPVCWCRRPLPGLGVVLLRRAEIKRARCLAVTRGPQDQRFAKSLGVESVDHEEFFRVE